MAHRLQKLRLTAEPADPSTGSGSSRARPRTRSPFDKSVLSERLILRQAQDERVEGLGTSGAGSVITQLFGPADDLQELVVRADPAVNRYMLRDVQLLREAHHVGVDGLGGAPAAGGEYRFAFTRIFSFGKYAISICPT